jgi:hypothetical protein
MVLRTCTVPGTCSTADKTNGFANVDYYLTVWGENQDTQGSDNAELGQFPVPLKLLIMLFVFVFLTMLQLK